MNVQAAGIATLDVFFKSLLTIQRSEANGNAVVLCSSLYIFTGVLEMRRVFFSCAVIVSLILTSASLSAQAPQSPGKEHEELKALTGVWDAAMKMADGSEVKAESEMKMICEGMWLTTDFRGDFGGTKFQGKGLDGYDSAKKQYVSVWVDSMSGSPMVMKGKKEGKVTTMTGEGPGPAGDAKYKTISTQDSSDKMSFQMFTIADGKDVEVMAVTYTRRKK